MNLKNVVVFFLLLLFFSFLFISFLHSLLIYYDFLCRYVIKDFNFLVFAFVLNYVVAVIVVFLFLLLLLFNTISIFLILLFRKSKRCKVKNFSLSFCVCNKRRALKIATLVSVLFFYKLYIVNIHVDIYIHIYSICMYIL